MKSAPIFFSLAFVAALAAAQADGIPSCANDCITKYTSGGEIAGCKQLDIACICKNNDFLNGIACCLSTACDEAGQEAAVQFAKQICQSQGVSTPDQVVCNQASSASASASASASPSASASSSASTQAASTTTESASATTESASGTKTSASAESTITTNAATPLGGTGSLVGAAMAMLVAL